MGNCHFKTDFDAENFTGKLSNLEFQEAKTQRIDDFALMISNHIEKHKIS